MPCHHLLDHFCSSARPAWAHTTRHGMTTRAPDMSMPRAARFLPRANPSDMHLHLYGATVSQRHCCCTCVHGTAGVACRARADTVRELDQRPEHRRAEDEQCEQDRLPPGSSLPQQFEALAVQQQDPCMPLPCFIFMAWGTRNHTGIYSLRPTSILRLSCITF
ncbi:unnamed protein product, partial [Urochloa decumbens]